MDKANRQFEDLAENGDWSFDWRTYFQAVLDHLWIVILCLVLGVAAAGFLLLKQEIHYSARAVIFLEQDKQRVLGKGVESVVDTQIRSIDMVNTVVETLKSYPFALRVAQRLQIGKNEGFLKDVGSEKEMPDKQAAGVLLKMVSASYREGTRLIDIVASTHSGDLSVLLADAYATEYLRLVLEQRTTATRSAGQFLVEEAGRLGAKMRVSEEALQSFRERERAASLETMLTQSQAHVSSLIAESFAAEKRLKEMENDLKIADEKASDADLLLQLPSIASHPAIATLNTAIEAQKDELTSLSQRYLPNHPLFTTATNRLQVLLQSRRDALSSTITQIKAQRDELRSQIVTLTASRAEAEQNLLAITGKSVEYNAINRDLQTSKALYEAVINRLNEVDLTKGLSEESIRIHESALGASPIPVPYVKFFALGIFGGLGLGVALAIGLNALDPSFRTVEQSEKETGLRVITAIPFLKKKNPGLITASDRDSVVAEAFRTARTSLALAGERDRRKVFLFTSALPSEGKTFCSANFAVALTQQGFRTLYMDADLRKPSVSKLVFDEHLKPGLSDILLGLATLQAAARKSPIENLTVITAGSLAPNPAELLAEDALSKFLLEARGAYDRIVIDSAPLIAVSDTLHLVRLADVTCLVIRAQATRRKSVNHAIRLLDDQDHPPTGIFLNMLNEGLANYAYSGRVHGKYGARGVYGGSRRQVP